jgi:Putative beta barrel porin-7 (BBP7)
MAVPRMPAAAVLLGAWAAACGQDPVPIAPSPPAARLAPMPGTATLAVPGSMFADSVPTLPPLLPIPAASVPPRKPCLPCQTEYQPNHVYLPDANPDCGSGGCDGECRPCRRAWVNLSFMLACSQDLGDIQRGLECGIQGGAGYWFSDARTLGLDVSFLNVHVPHHEVNFDTLINSPLTITNGDANLRFELLTYERYRLDGLFGYQYTHLHEDLSVASAGGPAFDESSRNNIHAADLGLVLNYKYGAYFCEVLTKVGIGRNSESLTLNGVKTSDSVMTVVPEFGARVGYQIGEGVFGTLGYNFIYLSNVTRPGRGDSDFYVHGITIGVECRF